MTDTDDAPGATQPATPEPASGPAPAPIHEAMLVPNARRSRRTGEELPPPELLVLARMRAEARKAGRYEDADRIRADIEQHGWKVLDRGTTARLVRAHPIDVPDPDGIVRYGWSGAVPAVTEPRDPSLVSVVLRAGHDGSALERVRVAIGDSRAQVVVVVDGDAATPALDPRADPRIEVVRIAGRATPGTALAIGLARARGEVIVVGEGWPDGVTGTRLTQLAALLDDSTVAIAGWTGLACTELPHFEPIEAADATAADPVAVAWPGLAFRVSDAAHTAAGDPRDPVDEAFTDPELFAAWWSLELRDEGPGTPPRAARALGLPMAQSDRARPAPAHDRRPTRRDRYRIIDRFFRRDDLLTDPDAADPSTAPTG